MGKAANITYPQELGPWCAAATLHTLLRQPSATGRGDQRATDPAAAAQEAAAVATAGDWLGLAPAPAMGLADSWCVERLQASHSHPDHKSTAACCARWYSWHNMRVKLVMARIRPVIVMQILYISL